MGIGGDITVTVCEVRGAQVRLGVQAPNRVEVHREEVYERIRADGSPARADTEPARAA